MSQSWMANGPMGVWGWGERVWAAGYSGVAYSRLACEPLVSARPSLRLDSPVGCGCAD